MTNRQRALVRHALGLPNEHAVSYRRHFVAGPGHTDFRDWHDLVANGDAVAGTARFRDGNTTFLVTRQGAIRALEEGERLDQEDFGLGDLSDARYEWR